MGEDKRYAGRGLGGNRRNQVRSSNTSGVPLVGVVRYDRNQQRKAWAVKRRKEQSEHQLTSPIKPVLVAQWRLRNRSGESERLRRGGKHIRPMLGTCLWRMACGSAFVDTMELFGGDTPPRGCDMCELLLEHLADTNEGRQKVSIEADRKDEFKKRHDAYKFVDTPVYRNYGNPNYKEPPFTCRGFRTLVDTLLMNSKVDMLNPESSQMIEAIADRKRTPTPLQIQQKNDEQNEQDKIQELGERTPMQIHQDREAYVAHYLQEGLIDEAKAKQLLAMHGWNPKLGDKELG